MTRNGRQRRTSPVMRTLKQELSFRALLRRARPAERRRTLRRLLSRNPPREWWIIDEAGIHRL